MAGSGPHYDAVIAGCGPVGATLANLLAAQGLTVCIVEKHRTVYDRPRAITFDWEGMRVLQFCGVAEAFGKGIRPHPGTDFLGMDGQVIKQFDPLPPPWDLGWPPTFTFLQPEMERLLREALAGRDGVTLLSGRSVAGFHDEGGRVTVDIADPERGESHTVTGDFLIGCDGANSDVRAALGLPLEDLGFDESWLVVDALQRRETALPAKGTQFCRPWRPATFIPGPGRLRRWELKIMPGETPAEFESAGRVRAVLADHVDIDAVEIWRSAAYRFAARVGTQWRKGRVLLAGDAVHQTPPFLGQGLGSGVRDAANLAWKLGHIRRTGFNAPLLDSYQAERRPHVVAVVAAAIEFGAVVGELDENRARARDAALAAELEAGRMETRRQKFIPDLAGGLLDPAPDTSADPDPGRARPAPVAGTLMVQPEILRPDGSARLMDDIVPMEFLYMTAGAAAQAWLDGLEDAWRAIAGRRLIIVPGDAGLPTDLPARLPAGVELMRERGDTFARWCRRTGLGAVLVRPDRYVHAGVTGRGDLAARVKRLQRRLAPH